MGNMSGKVWESLGKSWEVWGSTLTNRPSSLYIASSLEPLQCNIHSLPLFTGFFLDFIASRHERGVYRHLPLGPNQPMFHLSKETAG